jgi:hypothetical protein
VSARRALLLAALAGLALLGADAGDEPAAGFEWTPPRLALVEGEVSFLRPGADDWAPARANLALASGDRLYTQDDANVEIQLAPRAFLRAGERTELALESHEPDFLQLRVGSGLASLDLRSLPAGHTIELDTPNAAFTIEETGYYRLDVDEAATTLTCRRGGSATLVTPAGRQLVVGASEEVVVSGEDAASVESYAAPELDDWDLWNYRRTDRQLDSLSARYVAGDVYGVSDLDQYGSWRTVAPYGPIWIPRYLHAGWSPYGFGRWIWDPYFGWTWLDDAPWGWAPFHYGRWIHVHGHWAWAPGPLGVRWYYAPALVAFYGGHHTHVSWVPLGWGEPCRPWWGPRRWIGQPHWLGWSGPRIAGDTHENAKLRGGVVAVREADFGRKPVDRSRVAGVDVGGLRLVRGALPVERSKLSFVGADEKTVAPPKGVRERSVVSTRPRALDAAGLRTPQPRIVPAPALKKRDALPRPPFGASPGEERRTPEPPPRFEQPPRGREEIRTPKPPRVEAPKAPKSPKLPKPGKAERIGVEPQGELPGEPANRVYRGRTGPGGRPAGAPGLRPAPGVR